MKSIRNFYREHRVFTILMAIALVCFVLIGTIIIQCFYVGNGTDKYGNRLDGIEERKVTDEMIKDYTDPDSEKYKMMVDEICKRMNFTSLRYHRLDDLIKAIGLEKCKLCTYCFNGKEE